MAVTGQGATYQAAQQGAKSQGPRLQVKIFSPYQTYYVGEATSLSALNETGPFDVLPGHVNFFCLLVPGTVMVNTGFQELKFDINKGVLRVTRDQITLFANV